jgi:hypothetical protein
MALLTYSDLTAAVADWLMRDDLTARVPDFIAMGEDRMAKDVRVSDMETIATAYMGSGVVTLPSDFIEAIRITGNGAYDRPLDLITTQYAGENYFTSSAGSPTRYTITGNLLTTYPNGGSGGLTMIYYAKPRALDFGNATNWLYAKSPRLYLYAALCESAPFIQDDARLQTWNALYSQALDALHKADERKKYASSVSRVVGYCP